MEHEPSFLFKEMSELKDVSISSNRILETLEKEIIAITSKASKSLVMIISSSEDIECEEVLKGYGRIDGIGTGIYIDHSVIVTAAHIYHRTSQNNSICIVSPSGDVIKGKIMGIDNKWDSLFISTKKNGNPLNIEMRQIYPGSLVLACGIALGTLRPHFSLGILSGGAMTVHIDGKVIEGLLYSDAIVLPGMSGGPLVTIHGKVIGMIVGRSSDIGLSFAVPIKRLMYGYKILKQYGRIHRAKLGVKVLTLESVRRNLRISYGLRVIKVEKDSIAYRCGIREGDILLRINGIELRSIEDLWEAIDLVSLRLENIVIEYLKLDNGVRKKMVCYSEF